MATDKNNPVYATLEQLMALEGRVDAVERDIAAIKATLEQIDRRLGNVEEDIRELRKEVGSNFKWITGVMVGLWLSAVIPMLLRFLGIL